LMNVKIDNVTSVDRNKVQGNTSLSRDNGGRRHPLFFSYPPADGKTDFWRGSFYRAVSRTKFGFNQKRVRQFRERAQESPKKITPLSHLLRYNYS
jgi:hypothetical protein